MKKSVVFSLAVLLFVSLGLNVILCIKYVIPQKDKPIESVVVPLFENKYKGAWKAESALFTDFFVEADGSAMLVLTREKTATEEDPYAAFIKAVYKGHIEDNVVLLEKRFVSEYDVVQKLVIREEGAPEPEPTVIYHDLRDISDDMFEDTVAVYEISDLSENSIKIMDADRNEKVSLAITFIRQ